MSSRTESDDNQKAKDVAKDSSSAREQSLSTLNEKFEESFSNLNVVDFDAQKGLTLQDDKGLKYSMSKDGEVKDGAGKRYVFTQEEGKMILAPESSLRTSTRAAAEQIVKEFREGIEYHDLSKFKNEVRGLFGKPDSDPVKRIELERLSNHISEDLPGYCLEKNGLDEKTGSIRLQRDSDKRTFLLDQQGHMYQEAKADKSADSGQRFTLERGDDGKLRAHKLESQELRDKKDPDRFQNIRILRDVHNRIREVEMPNRQRMDFDYDKQGNLARAARLSPGGQLIESTTLDSKHQPPRYLRCVSRGENETETHYNFASVNQNTGALTLANTERTIDQHPNGAIVERFAVNGDALLQVWGANAHGKQDSRPGIFQLDGKGLVKIYTDNQKEPTQYSHDGLKYSTALKTPVAVSALIAGLPGIDASRSSSLVFANPTQVRIEELRAMPDGATRIVTGREVITAYPDGRVVSKLKQAALDDDEFWKKDQ